MHTLRTAIAAATLALTLVFGLVPAIPAYADTVSADEVLRNARGEEAPAPAEQTSEPVAVALASRDQTMKGTVWHVYKIMSASYDGTIGALKNDTLLYNPPITAATIIPEQPDLSISNVYTEVDDNYGSSNIKWDRLSVLVDNIERDITTPAFTITSDGEQIELPGTGIYLFVMEGHNTVAQRDEYLQAPFFTAAIKGIEELQTLQVPLTPERHNLANFAGDLTGQHQSNHIGELTAIYQPKNVPEDSQAAQEAKEAEEKAAAKVEAEENGGNNIGAGFLTSFAPIFIVIGAIFGLNIILKRRGGSKKGKKTTDKGTRTRTTGATIENDRESTQSGKTAHSGSHGSGAPATPSDKPLGEDKSTNPFDVGTPADDFTATDVSEETTLAIYEGGE